MAFIYNAHCLLRSVRTDEVTASLYHPGDKDGRAITYNGTHIRLSQIQRMHDEEHARYEAYIKKEIFFGEDIPASLIPTTEIEDIYDSANNVTPGYCFLDDPRNEYKNFRSAYGQWLLSDKERADRFVFMHDGKLVWKPAAAIDLLRRMETARKILAPGVAHSTLFQVRGAEFSRILLRNSTGALRNLRVEMRVLSHTALQDKTSHQHLKDRHIPHPITREYSLSLVFNVAVLRPFEEFLVAQFYDDAVLHRYRIQLWPGIKSTMTYDTFADNCGAITSTYLGLSFKPLCWRGLMTAFTRYLPNRRAEIYDQENYSDMSMMHSTTMSHNRYGRMDNQAPDSDYRTTVGCIRAALEFQAYVGIGQTRPFSLSIPSEALKPRASATEGTQVCYSVLLSYTDILYSCRLCADRASRTLITR